MNTTTKIINVLSVAAGILLGLLVAFNLPTPPDAWEPDPGYRWQDSHVTYSFYKCPTTLDCSTAYEIIRQAAAQWDAACGLSLTEVPNYGNIVFTFSKFYIADNKLVRLSETDSTGFATYPCQWMVGDKCAGSTVTFNNDQVWHTGLYFQRPGHESLPAIALHEIGHALGLAHNASRYSIMYAYQDGAHRLSLAKGDIAKIQALYGQ